MRNENPGISIVTATRLEQLAARLAGALAAAPLPPLADECIVVPGQGMRRWLTLRLADHLGVAASVAMPFPARFVHDLADAAAVGAAGSDRGLARQLDRDALAWRLYRLLAQRPPDELVPYLADDAGGVRRAQLARRVAARFDDYLLYRADMLAAWERGGDAGPGRHARWQAALWRAVVAELRQAGIAGDDTLGDRLPRLCRAVAAGEVDVAALPPRIAVFGASTLPPLLIDLLEAVGGHVPVTLHVPVPTPHFIADLRRRRGESMAETGGHPLLVDLGGQSRDLQARLLEAEERGAQWESLDDAGTAGGEDPGDGASLLAVVQDDLRAARVRGVDAGVLPLAGRATDGSLQVFSCHSPQRELEVLRDLLAATFEEHPDLRPGDVVVQVTDIAAYAPWIDAVFGSREAGVPRLPYRIADRGSAETDAWSAAFLRALALVGSRLEAPDVVELLEREPVRQRFGLTRHDLESVRAWVAAGGARWGIDGAHRAAASGGPEFEEGSWRLALDRLLAGVALGASVPDHEVVDLPVPLVPAADGTAGRAATLGELGRFVEALFALDAALRQPRPAAEAIEVLHRGVDELLAAGDDEGRRAVDELHAALADLDAVLHDAGCAGEPAGIETLRGELERHLDRRRPGAEFLSGAITFCALQPLRSVPFEVVCVLGLDDGVFPSTSQPLPFDLVAAAPRPGDRSPRGDDRQLFLETLLAPRRRLLLGRVGRSARDNGERAPSPCLEALWAVLERTFELGGRTARAVFEVEHPLHAHSRRYRDGADPRMFTYTPHRDASGEPPALRLVEPAGPPPETGPDAAAGAAVAVDLGDLVGFWRKPQAAWCRAVLGAVPRDRADVLDDCEPLALDRLAGYQVGALALELRRDGHALPQATPLAQRGMLPPGELGEAWMRRQLDACAHVLDGLPERYLDPAHVAVDGPGWRLTGELDCLTDAGRVVARPADIKGRDALALWIHHLVVCVAAGTANGPDVPATSRHVGKTVTMQLDALGRELALGHLDDLVRGRWLGLQRPLPFFPDAAHDFAAQQRQLATSSRARKDPMDAARERFAHDRGGAEGDSPEVRLCFRDGDALELHEPAFRAWTERIAGPIHAHARIDRARR